MTPGLLIPLLAGALAVPFVPEVGHVDEAAAFVLRSTPAGMVVEGLALGDGETKVLEPGGDRPVVAVILPPGTGGSAGLHRLSEQLTWILRREGEVLSFTVRSPDGQETALQPRRLSELRGQDIRVCVTTAAGARGAFLIRGYREVMDDVAGPVIDMFRGAVPLGEGDAVVCTRTMNSRPPGSVDGSAALAEAGGYLFVEATGPDGKPAPFILDFGAGTTVVEKRMVPEGVELQDVGMIEHSAAGTRRLSYQLGAATGDVAGFLGVATLPRLDFGEIAFEDIRVTVMESLPSIAGRQIAGILGVDLLQRADIVSFAYGGAPLRLASQPGAEPGGKAAPWLELPMALVGRTIYLPGKVAGNSLHLLMDTGSPRNLVGDATAAAIGLQADDTAAGVIHGLGGQPLEVRGATVESLDLGTKSFAKLPVSIGPLPIFDPIASGQYAALLGGAFFRQFDQVDVDFARNVLRLYR